MRVYQFRGKYEFPSSGGFEHSSLARSSLCPSAPLITQDGDNRVWQLLQEERAPEAVAALSTEAAAINHASCQELITSLHCMQRPLQRAVATFVHIAGHRRGSDAY
eukprot:6181971-Pleurochrysis_carterae.AAC.1